MSNKKKFFIIFLFIILDSFLLVGYLVIRDNANLNTLKKEVNELNKLDMTKDRYNRRIRTSGSYALVEKTIKNYLDDYSLGIQDIKDIMNDEELKKVLSYDNYQKDGFEFNESFSLLEKKEKDFNNKIDKLLENSKKETIEKYINEKVEDEYYNNLCTELMITDNRMKEFEKTKKTLEEIKTKVNNVIGVSREVLTLLRDNKDNCVLEDNQIKFKSKSVYDKYNELVAKIKED